MSQKVSFLVLDFKKPIETRACLESIKKYAADIDKEVILLSNGSNEDYPWELKKEGLCDILIDKNLGDGGGHGQTDLFRFCRTKYAFFVQNDNTLQFSITSEILNRFISLLETEFNCLDLNGDQSGKGIWTDRPHFIDVEFFNSLGPFPNSGPGKDNGLWNEQYLQEVFLKRNYKICHINPVFFRDCGKWSIRSYGKDNDGILRHRTDSKEIFVVKLAKEMSYPYPPLNEGEVLDMQSGNWPVWGKDKNGRIPEIWKSNSFVYWT